MKNSLLRFTLVSISLSLLCSIAQAAESSSETFDLFRVGEVLEVEVELDERDWDILRSEGRTLPGVLSGCDDPNFAYTKFNAQVSIAGESVSDVSVRNKGYLGSMSASKPSLKFDFGRDSNKGRKFHDSRRITLNNNRQDPSNVRQCMAYDLFARAGLPAPQCGLAQVQVNGVDQGVFTNVEPIDKAFLRREFGNDKGNLYELTVGDFTPEGRVGIELKTNKKRNNQTDIDLVELSLTLPDEQFVEALEKIFDMEDLFTFWAMEVITGHWDGMTGNTNNTFIYHNPDDGLFHAIPWGTDGSFEAVHPFRNNIPVSVFVYNSLSSRLYNIPEMRQKYHAQLQFLLEEVWDEGRIINQMREIVRLTDGDMNELAHTEDFVLTRRGAIENELLSNNGKGPDIEQSLSIDLSTCITPPRASGVIDFTWNDNAGALQPVQDIKALQLDIPLEDGSVQYTDDQLFQVASINEDGLVQLLLFGMDSTRESNVILIFLMPEESYRLGEVPFYAFETYGLVLQPTIDGGNEILGLIGDGSLTFTSMGRNNGDRIQGRWEGAIAPFPTR